MDDKTKKELQSATFDRLVSHLRERKDVQRSRGKRTCLWNALL